MERSRMAAGMFLIAHDEFTGKLRIGTNLLGCGLVSAQLAELVVAGRLGLLDGRVVARDGGPGPADDIADFVVESVTKQSTGHSVRMWTETLAEVLYELLARDLVQLGIVRRERVRGLLRAKPDRFPSVDLLEAARPRLRLESMLRRPKEFDLPGAFTAALVWTLGVDNLLDTEIDRQGAQSLVAQVRSHLPGDLGALLDGTAAAVAAAALVIRR